MDTPVAALADRVAAGEVRPLRDLGQLDHEALADALTGHALVVSPGAVRRVLRGIMDGSVTDAEAQAWASFVRRGYVVGSAQGPVKPLDITYDPAAEDAIVEAVSRLDELGDVVDGRVARGEVLQLIDQLDRTA